MSTPFLSQVAQFYINNSDLADTAFVFPNRRSALQFRHILKKTLKRYTFLPEIMSMNDFVDHATRHTDCIIASPVEILFIAFKAYKECMGDNAGEFDKFAYWGQLLVNDFNDIDMNLVDANDLYRNLKQEREIVTSYIEDDNLKNAINSILNISVNDKDDDKFWKPRDTDYNNDSVQGKFITLWNQLANIYNKFGEILDHHKLTTQGKLYREALRWIENTPAAGLGFSRIVMVGHDALTTSEMRMFKALQKKGVAHFWWDNAAQAFNCDTNPASKLIKAMAEAFPAPQKLEEIDHTPHIEVHAVPSVIGMAKCAFDGITAVSPHTAIVLPDESMLEPLINSTPHFVKGAEDLNITMGYPMKRSSITSLMHLVALAHKRASRKCKGESTEYFFFREDVRDILSHPILKMAFTREVMELNKKILENHEFNIPESLFTGSLLKPLFNTFSVEMITTAQVKKFLHGLEEFCIDLNTRVAHTESKLAKLTAPDSNDETGNDETGNDDEKSIDKTMPMTLQRAFIMKYTDVLKQLQDAVDSIGLPVHDITVFHLIDRMTLGTTLPFGGTSDVGIQVMGMLETRCLDFDTINILSANEGVLPQRKAVRSFIPDRYRVEMHMPSMAIIDAVDSYRFYRLIGRANRISLFYDTSNNSGNEPSRYIEQLHKVYHLDITRFKRTATVVNIPELNISLQNKDLKQRFKDKYTAGDPTDESQNTPCLSASSIKEYIKCPLMFYFHHLMRLSADNDMTEFMDSGTFGTIVHDSLEDLFTSNAKHDVNSINDYINNHLDKTLERNINKVFFHKEGDSLNDEITGQALILFETIKRFVVNALQHDIECIKEHGPITTVECEKEHKLKLKVGGTAFNFTFKADRIDRLGTTLRIIDYKTGGDSTDGKLEKMFDIGSKKIHPLALMQLLLYAIAYSQLDDNELKKGKIDKVQLLIYKLSKMEETGGTVDGTELIFEVTPEHKLKGDLIDHFTRELENCIKHMFSPDEAFTQTHLDDTTCNYCHFTDFCRR
ncbi:MAG: PD-(D/E)XK nuclease family protein [Bacteroidales bacterium]|nr:PD-(D/E)XK nuclease family protein [Candidatus Sodaliphilus limicaballi]